MALWTYPLLTVGLILLQETDQVLLSPRSEHPFFYASVLGALAGLFIGLTLLAGTTVRPVDLTDLQISQQSSKLRKWLEFLLVVFITIPFVVIFDVEPGALIGGMLGMFVVEVLTHFTLNVKAERVSR